MIRRWVRHRAEHWDREHQSHVAAAHLLQGTHIATHAEHYAERAKRRSRNWLNLLAVLG